MFQFRLFIGFKVIVAAGLLLLGGALVIEDKMNIGQFVAAEIIIILILNSVEKVLWVTETIYDVLTALDKIGFVADLELDPPGGKAVINTDRGLALKAREIDFGFPEEKGRTLASVSFDIQSNEKVVLAGKSGSGKTLLLQVLAGIYKVEDGELYINDIPVANYKRESIAEAFGVIFPANQIFEGSFKDNILLGRNVDEQHLTQVLRLLKLDEFIIHQPKGMESVLDSGGRRLPRSIIQKIHIARLIVGQPRLLLMEDPMTNIEDEEKKRIIDYIMDKERNWTVLVVSDFFYWKEKCDRIIDLDRIQNA
jgi:ABC-type bacteriocin/lantibiotic exporter with double-glycine peptidase domain